MVVIGVLSGGIGMKWDFQIGEKNTHLTEFDPVQKSTGSGEECSTPSQEGKLEELLQYHWKNNTGRRDMGNDKENGKR